ncbi:MAG: hypothetical protein KF774_16025 [Planctomyces sp.]|nr:hypothetical protein [Planctomyces sp.]
MSETLDEIARALTTRIVALASQDADLKRQLRRLAQAFLELTGDELVESPSNVRIEAAVEVRPAARDAEQTQNRDASERDLEALISRLTLGRSTAVEEPRTAPAAASLVGDDLALVESRCRLKSEGARWAARRHRLISEGARFVTEIEPLDRDIIARAKALPNCYLWMCHPSGPLPSNNLRFEEVAGCFEAAAEAIALVREIQEEPEADQANFEAALDLLAESQSALRVAVASIDWTEDHDQNEIFHWLRQTATQRQIFIQKHMRRDNPANPEQWADILNRIEELSLRVQEGHRHRRQRKRLLGKVRHKCSVIAKDPLLAANEWDTLISTVCELLEGGLPPSHRDLRELLLPVVDWLPETATIPAEFQQVLMEIDRVLATVPPPEATAAAAPTQEVADVAELLRGKSLFLIGGEKRPSACQALEAAFGLKELIWPDTRAHESIKGFAPYVARSDVAAVLLAIRWSSHSFGEVKTFCDNHDKPLIRLPGGYNPNQVAVQILAQASDRLR